MSERIFISTRKGLFKAERKTQGSWSVLDTSFLGSPVTQTLFDARDSTLYAALNLGHFGPKLHRSTDDGKSWQEITMPSFAPREDEKSVQLVWCLAEAGDDREGVLLCGTIPAGFFISTDRGDSWTLNESLTQVPGREKWFGGGYDEAGIHSICVDPRDSQHLSIAISCAGVWESTDGGEAWNHHTKGMFATYVPPEQRDDPNIQDPHLMVQCAADPDKYWVQHHNGIFRSSDGLSSWENIADVQPSTFGFTVAVHPQDADTAWFVPAVKDEFRYPVDGKFVVTRTVDGGKSFDQLSEGLPKAPAYDLVYRHGLDVDAGGQRLAMGSTTGGLWISEDGGNVWHENDARLPPIYAVKFA